MRLYYPITVDLYKANPLKIMEAQQGNTGRGAIVTLTAGGIIVDPTNEDVELYAKKPDGKVSWLECSVENKKIKIDFTNQMLMSDGMLQIELRLKKEDNDVTTPIFLVKINKSNAYNDAKKSENEIPILEQIVGNAGKFAENAANAAANAANEAAGAKKSAEECKQIAKDVFKMTDTVTGEKCVLSIENGILTIREAE